MLDTDELEIDRKNRADELGKKAVTIMITLHGGACLGVLGFVGSLTETSPLQFSGANIHWALSCFLVGIVSILVALLASYTFYASPPETRLYQFWNRFIVQWNSTWAIVSLVSFIFGFVFLIFGVTTS